VTTTTQPTQPGSADIGRALRRRWWLVALVALIGATIGAATSALLPQTYSATVTLVVQLPKGSADTEALVRTVEALTTSSVVLGDIATNSGTGLSPNGVQDRLQVDRPSGSAVIEVAVLDTSRARARAIAQQVVPSLQQRITESRNSAETSSSRIAVESFGGGPEVQAVTPPILRNALIGAMAGFALGLLLAVAEAGRAARRASLALPGDGRGR
jgi:capsular polysaccharide biosynthesis protein